MEGGSNIFSLHPGELSCKVFLLLLPPRQPTHPPQLNAFVMLWDKILLVVHLERHYCKCKSMTVPYWHVSDNQRDISFMA